MRKTALMVLCFLVATLQLLAQTKTLSGKVTDDKGAPVANATVQVKGTNLATMTKADGTFAIAGVPEKQKTVIISSVGFATIEVPVSELNAGAVQLKVATNDLDEVVVTGYTRQKKSQFAGAASNLSGKVVETVPVGAFDQALQGRAAGVQVQSGSGQPGASASITIRGVSSIQASGAQPLFIIDGVPASAQDMQAINPNDFESLTILKDANSAALYGARGALGVIVITTKKGKAGQTKFTYRTQVGFTQKAPDTNFDMMNTKESLQYEEIMGALLGGTAVSGPGWRYSAKNPANANLTQAAKDRNAFLLDSLGSINSDWTDILFRQGFSQSHEINMQGGSEKTKFFTSMGYFDQQGTDLRSRLRRYTGRFNLDHTEGKLNVQWNTLIGYAITDLNEGDWLGNSARNPFQMTWRAKNYENPYRPDGSIIFGANTALNPRQIGNVLEGMENSIWTDNQLKMNSGLTLSYRLLPTLTAKNVVGIDAAFERGQRAINANSYVGSLQTYNAGYNTESFRNRAQIINTSSLVFNNRYGLHDVEVGGYFEVVRSWTKALGFQLWNLDPRLGYTGQGAGTLPTGGAATTPQQGSSASSGFGIRSYFANARYTYDGKYTITGNIRRDGTSRILNENNKQINTFSVGAIWDAGKESFIKNLGIFNDLRLRASYGSVPNIGSITSNTYGITGGLYGVPNYLGPQLPSFGTTTGFAGSSITGLVPTTPGNPDYKIEYVEKTNIGIDLSVWKGRARLSVDAYRNLTKDLFVNQPLGATTGFGGTSLPINAGTMSNKGLEFVASVDIVRNRQHQLTFSWNHAINVNKIEDLGLVDEYVVGTYIIRKGLPFGSHFTYDYLGAEPATGRPQYRTQDDKVTTNLAQAGRFATFGTYLPKHVGGFNLDYTFGNFNIAAFFSYQTDVSRYNNIWNWITRGTPGYFNAVNHSRTMFENQWQKPGDVKLYQSPAFDRDFTSADIQDAKFLRFRNLNIAYNLPGISAGGKKIISGVRFYVQVQNLMVWSPWKGPDPEDNNNLSLNEFPNPRTIVTGLDINF